MPLERAGVGVEHDHAAVAVAVGDEQPRWSSDRRRRRPAVARSSCRRCRCSCPARRSAAGTFPCCRTSAACRRRALRSDGDVGRCRRSRRCPCSRRRCRARCRASRSPVPGPPQAFTNLPVGVELEHRRRRLLRCSSAGVRTVQQADVIAADRRPPRRRDPAPSCSAASATTASTSKTGTRLAVGTPAPARHRSRASRPSPSPRRRQRPRRDSATLIDSSTRSWSR